MIRVNFLKHRVIGNHNLIILFSIFDCYTLIPLNGRSVEVAQVNAASICEFYKTGLVLLEVKGIIIPSVKEQ